MKTIYVLFLFLSRINPGLTASSKDSLDSLDCYKISPGRRLSKSAVSRSFQDVIKSEDCLRKCRSQDISSICTALSFGYEEESKPICELSHLNPSSASDYNTQESGSFDLFELKDNCSVKGEAKPRPQSPLALPRSTRHSTLDSQCYFLKFGSRRFPDHLMRSRQTSASLLECQRLCSSERGFACRGLSFTYTRNAKDFPSTHNCILTDRDLSTANKFDSSIGLSGEAFTDIYVRNKNSDWCRGQHIDQSKDHSNPFQSLNTLEQEKCYQSIKKSYKHYAYRDYASVKSLNECYIRCRDSGYCRTFSFRFSRGSYLRSCLLSHRRETELNPRDLVSTHRDWEDSRGEQGDWEVFSLNLGRPSCTSYGPNQQGSSNAVSFSNCFKRVGPMSKHYGSAIYGSVNARDTLSCSVFCHKDSRCRSFSFPTISMRANIENCALSGFTSSGTPEKDFEKDFNWNAYEILDPGNPLCSESEASLSGGGGTYRDDSGTPQGKIGCFRRENYGFSFQANSEISVGNVNECFRRCKAHKQCATLSFISKTNHGEPNCLLSGKKLLQLEKDNEILGKNFADLYSFSLNCQEGMSRECEMIINTGFGLHDSVLKSSLNVDNFEECSDLCRRDGACIYYAYKFNLVRQNERNCEISAYDSLGSQDFVPNSNWNVYVQLPKCRNETKLHLQGNTANSKNESISEHECYDLTKAGYRHGVSLRNSGVYLKSIPVKSIKECRSQCDRSSSGKYVCLSFSYRYDQPDRLAGVNNAPNCILSTASAPRQITSWNQEENIVPDTAWDVYNRNIQENRCFPSYVSEPEPVNSNCIDVMKNDMRHSNNRVLLSLRRIDLKSCLMACLSSSSCLTFSYRPYLITRSPGQVNNCLLSDVREPNILSQDVLHENGWQILAPRFDGVFRKCFPSKDSSKKVCYRKYSHSGPLQRVSKSLSTQDFDECLRTCAKREHCLTFDYINGTDVKECFLSSFDPFENPDEVGISQRRSGRDGLSSRDVYVFQTCSTPKCSRLFKKSHRLNPEKPIVYRIKSMTSDTLENCEGFCLTTDYKCEYFAFRAGLIGSNCEVMIQEDSKLGNGGGILQYDREWNVYKIQSSDFQQRGDGTKECPGDYYADASLSPNHFQNTIESHSKYPLQCFDPFWRANMDLRPRVVSKIVFVRSREECAIECLRLRTHCSAFSYRYEKSLPYKDCKLSDIYDRNPERDLQQDNYHEIWELSSRCALSHYNSQHGISHNEGSTHNSNINYPFFSTYNVSSQGIVHESQGSQEWWLNDSQNPGISSSFQNGGNSGDGHLWGQHTTSHSGISGQQNGNGFVSLNQGSGGNSYKEHLDTHSFVGQNNQAHNYYPTDPSVSHYHQQGGGSSHGGEEHRYENSHYSFSTGGSQANYLGQGTYSSVRSVNGLLCMNEPEMDSQIGFLFCSTSLGGIDYVCRPESKCTVQSGYSYPWCYVGQSKTQWRPCKPT